MTDIFDAPDWSAIPAPADDGAARHLPGRPLPSVPLTSTDGKRVDLAALPGLTVVYAYPRTARAGREIPPGWDLIPGARGCTPQACAFRDHYAELTTLGVNQVFGLSTQDTHDQREAVARLHLPFPLLSDAGLYLAMALDLPTFKYEQVRLLKRCTLIVAAGIIEHVFYPVFPPDRNAEQVIEWLATAHRE